MTHEPESVGLRPRLRVKAHAWSAAARAELARESVQITPDGGECFGANDKGARTWRTSETTRGGFAASEATATVGLASGAQDVSADVNQSASQQ